jgi:hypothetical protein
MLRYVFYNEIFIVYEINYEFFYILVYSIVKYISHILARQYHKIFTASDMLFIFQNK